MPVVATNVGDISSAVIDGENGYLIEPGDVLAIKQAIEKIVWDPEVFNKMVTASRQLAESGFSDEKYFSCINDLYKEIGD